MQFSYSPGTVIKNLQNKEVNKMKEDLKPRKGSSTPRKELTLTFSEADKRLLLPLIEEWMRYVTQGEADNAWSCMDDYCAITMMSLKQSPEDYPEHIKELVKQTEILRHGAPSSELDAVDNSISELEAVAESESLHHEQRLFVTYRPTSLERKFLDPYRDQLRLPGTYSLKRAMKVRNGAGVMLAMARVNLAEQKAVETPALDLTTIEIFTSQKKSFISQAEQHVRNCEKLYGFFIGMERLLRETSVAADKLSDRYLQRESDGLHDLQDLGLENAG